MYVTYVTIKNRILKVQYMYRKKGVHCIIKGACVKGAGTIVKKHRETLRRLNLRIFVIVIFKQNKKGPICLLTLAPMSHNLFVNTTRSFNC